VAKPWAKRASSMEAARMWGMPRVSRAMVRGAETGAWTEPLVWGVGR